MCVPWFSTRLAKGLNILTFQLIHHVRLQTYSIFAVWGRAIFVVVLRCLLIGYTKWTFLQGKKREFLGEGDPGTPINGEFCVFAAELVSKVYDFDTECFLFPAFTTNVTAEFLVRRKRICKTKSITKTRLEPSWYVIIIVKFSFTIFFNMFAKTTNQKSANMRCYLTYDLAL